MIAIELAELFRRELTRLIQELDAFPDRTALWLTAPGVTNSAGNLALHLEGNLREFIGRQLGGIAYQRERDLEFVPSDLPVEELIRRIEAVREMVPRVLASLEAQQMEAPQTHLSQDPPLTTRQFLIHLLGHLSFHLGQIDYLRRILTQGAALQFARLEIGPRG